MKSLSFLLGLSLLLTSAFAEMPQNSAVQLRECLNEQNTDLNAALDQLRAILDACKTNQSEAQARVKKQSVSKQVWNSLVFETHYNLLKSRFQPEKAINDEAKCVAYGEKTEDLQYSSVELAKVVSRNELMIRRYFESNEKTPERLKPFAPKIIETLQTNRTRIQFTEIELNAYGINLNAKDCLKEAKQLKKDL